MKLARNDNVNVRSEILRCVGRGGVTTRKVIEHVLQNVKSSIPYCNAHHVSGLISALDREKTIRCIYGICW